MVVHTNFGWKMFVKIAATVERSELSRKFVSLVWVGVKDW